MARRKRDYRKEYARRIQSALARGLSRAQARGHPPAGTFYTSRPGAKPGRLKTDARMEAAINAIRAGETLSAAAKRIRVGRERLSAYAKEHAGAVRTGRTWTFRDNRTRRIPIISAEAPNPIKIRVRGSEPAALAGRHYAEAGKALEDQSLFPAFIERWSGVTITDASGRTHPLATDPNHLYRAFNADEVDWSRIYRLYMN